MASSLFEGGAPIAPGLIGGAATRHLYFRLPGFLIGRPRPVFWPGLAGHCNRTGFLRAYLTR